MINGWLVGFFFNGEFVAIPTDSCKETEMFLDSFGAEETIGDISDEVESITGTSENPSGILEVIKNKIMIRDKTDFNQKLPQHKKLQKFLGVELILQKFGVDLGLGD
jgi:hypothetical protein